MATVRLADYRPAPCLIERTDLRVQLFADHSLVEAELAFTPNPAGEPGPLELRGEELELLELALDGEALPGAAYRLEPGRLVLLHPPARPFQLRSRVRLHPETNTTLEGLYVSGGLFTTQCEAEGFRRITFHPDRPDLLSRFRVRIEADRESCPVLLSNGNCLETGELPGDPSRHYAIWDDPFPKPSYLFALVAGRLDEVREVFTTRSGRDVQLRIHVEPGDLPFTAHAMASLKRSMAWDEQVYGLDYDLDEFNIVAVRHFNMGAMENKSLNIFNSKLVLADAATATDAELERIESVIAHEYFHNWTGNRITCRDWFQLSLKEGLTVFRDQEFSQDMAGEASARAVKRIEDVRVLRTVQFAEDAGPMAHPVRPDSYVEINNFYTVTIYEKGSEVVRMMQTLVATPDDLQGRSGFAKGMKLYFARHDGQAVTCDDFAQAIADANPGTALAEHLSQFKRWYSQAGTPRLQARGVYNAAERSYTLTLSQSCPATPDQASKQPFVIPVTLGLLSRDGQALPLQLAGSADALPQHTLVLTEASASYTFVNIDSEPVPSLLRGFSAPVVLQDGLSTADLLCLLAHDSDPFNQWEAGQRLMLQSALQALSQGDAAGPVLSDELLTALRNVLRHPGLDAAFKDLALTLPSENYIADQLSVVDPQRVHTVREAMRLQLATALQADWQWAWDAHQNNGAYSPDAKSSGRRALAGLAMGMLCIAAVQSGDDVTPGRVYQQFKDAGNMTDRFNALSALVLSGHALAHDALARFHKLFQHEALVIDKWFALQAGAPDRAGDVLPRVRQLMQHPDFSLRNPNRARSLIFSYCNANPAAFHRTDAAGYVYWSEQVLALDAINPQVAARLARAMDRWSRLAEPYRSAAKVAIERVAAKTDLSNDVREVISRALSST